MKEVAKKIELAGRTLRLEYGKFAKQADSSVLARYGDTMVLVTVAFSYPKQELDYFPLTVDYIERLYAGGRIKGSRWVKREGKPTDEEILSARLIDRSVRPLFPKDYRNEVQIVATVLSVDLENDPSVLAAIAASAALTTSSIPWDGPVGTLRIGMKEDNYFANPTTAELEFSDLDLICTFGKEAIFMIEAGASQVSEEKITGALEFGQRESQKIIAVINELSLEAGVKKQAYDKTQDKELVGKILKKFGADIDKFLKDSATKESGDGPEIKKAIIEELGENAALVSFALDKAIRERLRALVLSGKRVDGRKHEEIRPISGEVGVLPRTHGSAVFTRGQTSVLTVATLGSPSLGQLIESAEGEEEKRYIHHYSMPPYATGETGRIGTPNRREIGHGALAERALLPVIPSEDRFPYAIRVVSEVVSSNGSTSMASTCGSTMSLMDAGVPILSPVSGIAMGLVIEKDDVAILSDIAGIEDAGGDMDFKVAGTKEGVTAMQLDVKTPYLTVPVLERALKQAKEGRLFILQKMLDVIPESRVSISQYAPKIVVTRVPVEKIGEVIGPGGRVIKKIMGDTGASLDVEDDGSVTITGVTEEAVEAARKWVESLVKEAQPGEIYEGEVKRIQPFGAFVEILPGKDGLVHVSDMSREFVKDPSEIVKVGDKIKVRVKEIDDLGRINLSMILEGEIKKSEKGEWRERKRERFGQKSGMAYKRRSAGPHFPASRFLPKKKKF